MKCMCVPLHLLFYVYDTIMIVTWNDTKVGGSKPPQVLTSGYNWL